MIHNGILASHSALRNFNFMLTKESMQYICKQMGFKSLTSMRMRLSGVVPCDVIVLNKMIEHLNYFKQNVATTFIGNNAQYDHEQLKEYYNALLAYIGTKDYNALSSKKKSQLQDEQKSIYKQLKTNKTNGN
jgi:pyruvate carboxylase